MKYTKIVFSFLLVLIITLTISSCASQEEDDDRFQIVCTIFPEYEFINAVIGNKADLFNVTMLISDGTDMHSYQPTVSQIAKITKSDLFCYIGGGSQNWVNNILKNIDPNQVSVLSLAKELEDKLIRDSHEHEKDNHDHSIVDEHIWLSLELAKESVLIISEKISAIDPENEEYYHNNAEKYIANLEELDTDFRAALESACHNTVVVADRFPFVYLFRDYGIDYFAAFEGCSQESDAGVKTIIDLAEKLKKYSLDYVIILENSDKSVAEAVIRQSGVNAEMITLNSCQTITKEQIDAGADYIDIMKSNLEELKKALGCNLG